MQTPPNRNLTILQTLVDHQVEFLIVGGVAAVLLGAPINTFDLDVVHSTDPANVSRVLAALEALDAIYRAQPDLRLRPTASHLSSPGHQLLITRLGPLDLLGSIGNGRTYPDLLSHTTELKAGPSLSVKVLDLETQIAIKEEVGGEKDRAALPILRRTLEERRKG
jgi:predicted nucleotidyltransferase